MSKYPIVKLGQHIYEIREQVGNVNGSNLPVLGVTNIAGITVTGKKASDDLSKYIKLKHNYFAYNPYRINVGSIGLSKNQDGVVSPAYVVFTTKPELNPNYLFKYLKSQEGHQHINFYGNRGSVRQALRFADLCKIEIPLPSLPEQQRIVARIEKLTSRIEETKSLRHQTQAQAKVLLNAVFEEILSKANKYGWKIQPLCEVCEINPSRRGKMDYPDDLSVTFVPMTAVDENTGTISSPEIVPFAQVKKGYTWFIEGDVIFARITPCMQNGKAAIATNLSNGIGFGSTEFHVLRPKNGILSEWIHHFVRRPKFRKLAENSFKGTAGQQRVPQVFFESQSISIPPISEQHKIISHLDKLQSHVDELRKYQAETQKQLEALTQSILSKAFRGES